MTHVHTGRCFCGAIEVEARGEPVAMGYCHCSSCRSWSASPVNAFTLWKPGAVRVTSSNVVTQPGTSNPKAVVTFYEDFLCPACGNFERNFGATVETFQQTSATTWQTTLRAPPPIRHSREPTTRGDRSIPKPAAACCLP